MQIGNFSWQQTASFKLQKNLDLVNDYICQAAMCVFTKPVIGPLCAPTPIAQIEIVLPQLKQRAINAMSICAWQNVIALLSFTVFLMIS